MVKWNHPATDAAHTRPRDPQPHASHARTVRASQASSTALRDRWVTEPARSASALMIGMR